MTRGGASEAELLAVLALRPGERVLEHWWGTRYLPGEKPGLYSQSARGYLVLTDRRLALVREQGVFTPTHILLDAKDLDGAAGVSAYRVTILGPWQVKVSWQGADEAHAWFFNAQEKGREGAMSIQRTVQGAVRHRLEALQAERDRARVQYVLDFSFLKAQMEQGGIVVSTVKCPSCGGSLRLPDTGTRTTCGYCGASLLAQDIFDRMNSMIGGSPYIGPKG